MKQWASLVIAALVSVLAWHVCSSLERDLTDKLTNLARKSTFTTFSGIWIFDQFCQFAGYRMFEGAAYRAETTNVTAVKTMVTSKFSMHRVTHASI